MTLNKKVKKDLDKYIKSVTLKYNIDEIYLFGSYAKGNNKKNSDLDVAVVSEDAGRDRHTFLVNLIKMKRGLDILIEPHPMTKKDLKDPYYTLGNEVTKHGIKLYSKHWT